MQGQVGSFVCTSEESTGDSIQACPKPHSSHIISMVPITSRDNILCTLEVEWGSKSCVHGHVLHYSSQLW